MDAMSDAYTADQHARTGALFASIKQVLDRGDGPWIYGAAYSVIDAQFTVLFHRLRNVGKRALVDDAGLTAYADRLLAVPQWKEVGGAC
jgi:glutathione S-transferase